MANSKILILDGMTSVIDADLNGLALSFLNAAGGIVGANDYLVTAQGTPNMTVAVGSGRSWMPNTTSPATNMYGTYQSISLNVTVANNSSGLPRIDYIISYLDLALSPAPDGSNISLLADIQGTPAASPQAPTGAQIQAAIGVGNPYLILAQIGQSPTWIPNGVSSITSAMITSKRTFAFFTTGQTVSVPQYMIFTDQASPPANPSAGTTEIYTIGSNLFLRQPTGPSIQIGSSSFVNNGNSGSTPSIDWTQGITQAFTLNENNVVFSLANPIGGGKYLLFLTQDASGSRTVASNGWPNVLWSNNVAPILSTTPAAVDVVGLVWNTILDQYIGFYQTGF